MLHEEVQDIKNLVIFAGPSAGGKDTTVNQLINGFGYKKLISTTTRPMRNGETNGEQYHFMAQSAFMDVERIGGFLETVEFCGNYYGLGTAEFDNLCEFSTTIMTPAGIKAVEKYLKKNERKDILLTKVYIDVSLEEQIHRLQVRGCSINEILTRLQGDLINIKKPILNYDLVLNSSIQIADEITYLVNSLVLHNRMTEGAKRILRQVWELEEKGK